MIRERLGEGMKFKRGDRVTMPVGDGYWHGTINDATNYLGPTGNVVRISWDQQEIGGAVSQENPKSTSGWLPESTIQHECVIRQLGSLVGGLPDESE